MTIERFTRAEFEDALPRHRNTNKPLWETLGFVQGELAYTIPVTDTNKRIVIRSSIDHNGYAADTGQDSIRLWIEYSHKGQWRPLKRHKSRWTTRVPGWDKRMIEKLRELYQLALDDDKRKPSRPAIALKGEIAQAQEAQAEADAYYRAEFAKREAAQEAAAMLAKNEEKLAGFLGDPVAAPLLGDDEPSATPNCPRCGREMVQRKRRSDGSPFWGCPSYPRCKGTRSIQEQPKAEPEQERPFVPSAYQEAIFQWIKDNLTVDGTSLVVQALAGSGKTTTIVQALQFTPKEAEVAFVAFNRLIANTLGKKAPQHVHTSTLHSLGLGNIRAVNSKVKVEGRKLFDIVTAIKEQMPYETAAIVDVHRSTIQRLVGLCKATMVQPTADNLDRITDRWNLELNGERDLIYKVVARAFKESVSITDVVDFDDMIYFCATGMVPCRQFDWLFVDETQDLNKSQLEMAVRSVKTSGHIVAVGDANQSIYGFRGADTEAIPRIIERLKADVLPLSISYRNPKSHVANVQHLVPEMEAAEWAKDGIIENVTDYGFRNKVQPGDLVLCRTNAPLVKPAFALIRDGIKAVILGRDIGKGLMVLVKKVQKKARVVSLADTLEALEDYRSHEVHKLLRAKKTSRAESLNDKVETIVCLADNCWTVNDLERKIEQVFSDQAEGVTFSTVHKAKGAEAERVFILKRELMPHPMATKDWELVQEQNILYVALTRSKSELYFVS